MHQQTGSVANTPLDQSIFNNQSTTIIILVLVYRKLLSELHQIDPFAANYRRIVTIVNAVFSDNIEMIQTEISNIESLYKEPFLMHPLGYFQILRVSVKDYEVEFRKIVSFLLNLPHASDLNLLNVIDAWLVTCDLECYRDAVRLVYA